LQFEKQDSQITSIDAGTIIAVKPLLENASFSSSDNFDSVSIAAHLMEDHESKMFP
jgi:hypothetical protein